MVRVVLDTNVLVSSLVNSHTPPAKIFDCFSRKLIEIVVSEDLVGEYLEVLTRSSVMALHKRSLDDIVKLVTDLEKQSIVVVPLHSLDVVELDSDDNIFIECAVAGNAEFIVSGDKHLLALGSFQGIQIVTPANFVMFIEHEIG